MHDFPLPYHARYSNHAAIESSPTLFVLGLCIRLSCIGAATFVAALVALLDADTSVGTALTVAAAGAIVGTLAWSRVYRALRADKTAGQSGRTLVQPASLS